MDSLRNFLHQEKSSYQIQCIHHCMRCRTHTLLLALTQSSGRQYTSLTTHMSLLLCETAWQVSFATENSTKTLLCKRPLLADSSICYATR